MKKQTEKGLERVLDVAHMDEIARRGVGEVWNWGAVSSPTQIQSKTDKGILVSRISAKGKVKHLWRETIYPTTPRSWRKITPKPTKYMKEQ